MPIILGDDNKTQVVDVTGGKTAVAGKNRTLCTPKFFHNSVLTGHGGTSRGLLNEAHDPKMFPNGYPTNVDPNLEHGTTYNKDLKIYNIPFFILTPSAWSAVDEFDRPDPAQMTKIAVGPKKEEVWLWMPIHAVQVEEKTIPAPPGSMMGPTTSRNISACFHEFLFVIRDHADINHLSKNNLGDTCSTKEKKNTFFQRTVFNMVKELRDLEKSLTAAGYVVDKQTVQDFFTDYSLYDQICKAADRWQNQADYYIADVMVKNLDKKLQHPATFSGNSYGTETILTDVLARLEKHSVPLDQYQSMYKKMSGYLQPGFLNGICKANLNLKLSDTLQHMHQNRANLLSVPCNVHIQGALPYSIEQRGAIESTSPLTLVQSGAGTGKALDLYTPVLTPSGWVLMKDLKVGSRIIGSDGKAHKVTHIWDHADKKAYKLTFRDGSSVIACDEHLWATEYVDDGIIRRREITTAQWVNERKYRNYDFLPMVQPVQYGNGKDKKLPIDPYLLGALLADGCLCQGRIQYTKSEQSVIDAVRDRAWMDGFEMREMTCTSSTARQWRFDHPSDTTNKSIIKRRIKALGLDVKSRDKFIPEEYKMASIKQRKALLHGLFDGDGNIRTGRGYARYNTASDQMAEDVLQLLWSLGLAATKQKQKHSRGDYWSVNLLDSSWDPFLASEHKGKATGSVRPMRRSLASAEYLDNRPMRCIAVDTPDKLYVTKDFIVTHNSTVILGRIDHMIANGINPDDITVLSFTNAAADHIVDMKPGIHSMTIASMLHTIYTHNYPNQQLSSLSTIINSIDIYFNNSTTRATLSNQKADFLGEFKYYLGRLRDNGEYTRMVNFVEAHMDDVLDTLDTIEQTTLELESIICYLNMDTLVEPPEVQTKHLIIDEVQDNSVSEFIYSIKYTDKHCCSLYIVGDCSQTLYEFRASNPKALNILEGSGVFETHKLQTNYRSNQEILDFANVVLGTIEANQYANIQLRANSLKPVTLQSFQDAVRFMYTRIPNRGAQTFDTTIAHTIAVDTRKYIQEVFDRKEQVAILAYKHAILNSIEKHLQNVYPDKKIVKISPSRGNDSTLFSKFIAMFWDNVTYTPPLNILITIRREIMANINALTSYKSQNVVQKTIKIATDMMDEIDKTYGGTVANWQKQVANSVMTTQEMLDELKKLLISYEIKRNSAAQAVRSAKAAKAKEDLGINDADFILSTVHSAKGLEFDNVMVYYDNNPNDGEPEKRLYYVAFTRAKKSEFIVAFGEQARPKIQGDYDRIVKTLEAQAQANTPVAAAAGDDDSGDGTSSAGDAYSSPFDPDAQADDGTQEPAQAENTSGESGLKTGVDKTDSSNPE